MPLKEKEKGQKGHIHWKSQHALCRFQAWDGLTHFYTRSNTSLSRKLTASRLFLPVGFECLRALGAAHVALTHII